MELSILKMLIKKVLKKYNTEFLYIISDLKQNTEIKDDKGKKLEIDFKTFSDLLVNKIEKNFKNSKLIELKINANSLDGFVLYESEGTNYKKKIKHEF